MFARRPIVRRAEQDGNGTMLYWFIVSAVAAAIGGTLGIGITAASIGIAQVLLVLISAFVLISLLNGVVRLVR